MLETDFNDLYQDLVTLDYILKESEEKLFIILSK